MEMNTLGPGAGWSWLIRGIKSGFQRPQTLFGAAALFVGLAFVIGMVQAAAQFVVGQSIAVLLTINIALMLVGVVVYPVLFGGYLRILDAVEHERPAAARDLFSPFQSGGGAGSLIMVGIVLMLVYALFLALLYFTIGHGVGTWYMQIAELGMQGGDKPAALPPFPSGFAATFALLMVFFIFYSAAFAIAIGQVALGSQPVLASIKDGMVGALKNLLPLLVLAVCSFFAFIVFAIGLAVLVAVVAALGSLVGPVFAMILIVPVYAAVVLLTYLVMFGVMYALWQDVSGSDQGGNADSRTTSVEV